MHTGVSGNLPGLAGRQVAFQVRPGLIKLTKLGGRTFRGVRTRRRGEAESRIGAQGKWWPSWFAWEAKVEEKPCATDTEVAEYDLEASFEFEVNPEEPPRLVEMSLIGENGKDESEVQEIRLEAKEAWKPTVQSVGKFRVSRNFKPGLLKVKNLDENHDFRLIAVTLSGQYAEDLTVPCFSWVEAGQGERYFACGLPTLRADTPKGLMAFRDKELKELQGTNSGTRGKPERIYDYDTYSDLGKQDDERPIIGGQPHLPYPRRYRTGRDTYGRGKELPSPASYVPKDDDFLPPKAAVNVADVVGSGVFTKAAEKIYEKRGEQAEFRSLQDVEDTMYTELKFPEPFVYDKREQLWKKDIFFSDFEFGRQRIAGPNPCTIKAVDDLSSLGPVDDDTVDTSLLDGEPLSKRVAAGRIFCVDYRTEFFSMKTMEGGSVLNELNEMYTKERTEGTPLLPRYLYAPLCVLYFADDGSLLPVAIDLAIPGKSGKVYSRDQETGKDKEADWAGDCNIHRVYTPKDSPTEWAIAKGHFMAADSCVHQLYSHFTRTHCNEEAYAIAMRRQMSSMHPIHRLLLPHFKDTFRINAAARSALINAQSIIEQAFGIGKFCMTLAAVFYGRNFRFKTEGLPMDLEKRGMAKILTENGKQVVKLVIEDYPYAADGLLVWNAMENWVTKYVDHYYKNDQAVTKDKELEGWWKEIMDEGHPDVEKFGYAKRNDMWPPMKTKKDLVYALVTIMWHASAFHSAINFGQYDFLGYMPSNTSLASLPLPERGSHPEHTRNEAAYLTRMGSILSAAKVSSFVSFLSKHYDDEEYIGDEIKHYFQDEAIENARKEFKKELEGVAARIAMRNKEDPNRSGRLSIDYNLLSPYVLPDTGSGSGIPNSVSI